MAEITHHTASVKDIKLRYALSGSGEPVVLLHGWPQSGAEWSAVIPGLSEKYTVIVPDMRGMGASSKAPLGYDVNNLADDIHELVRLLGHEKIFIAGHDWGAAVAFAYAAQFRDETRRLAIFEMLLPGFGLMEGAMQPRPGGEFLWHMAFQSIPDIPEALITGREDIYLNWFFETYAYDPDSVRPEAMKHYVDAMRSPGAVHAGLQYYTHYFKSAEQNQEHAKHKLTMPVLAFGGEASAGGATRQCLELAAENVRGGVIERCGHWVGEERPDFVTEQLLAFFGEEP